MRLIKLVLVAALAVAPAMTFAQTTATEQSKNPIVKHEFKREFNQQQRRIGNGIKNDRLTPRQGARLERQQMRVHRQFRSDACAAQRAPDHERAPHDPSPAVRCIAQDLPRETSLSAHWVMR